MQKFTITNEHLSLMQKMNIIYDARFYYGAPTVDQKRPYGNSDIVSDIAEIIGIEKIEGDDDFIWPKGTTEKCISLHKETAIALQICLHTMSFQAGDYVSDDYMDNWRLA